MRSKLFRILLIGMIGLSTAISRAQTDEQLYMSYMQSDLTLWKQYIDSADWKNMNAEERLRLINYEYGYVPFIADKKDPTASHYLEQYIAHVEEEKANLTPSVYASYMCAAHAYTYLLDKSKLFSSGLQSFRLAKKAVELDPNNSIALVLKGNVYFYAPRAFGGNKEEAMRLFARAERIMQQEGKWRYLWNYPALQLCIAQCYDKLGDTDSAYRKCRAILKEHPNFRFITETYLPELEKKRNR